MAERRVHGALAYVLPAPSVETPVAAPKAKPRSRKLTVAEKCLYLGSIFAITLLALLVLSYSAQLNEYSRVIQRTEHQLSEVQLSNERQRRELQVLTDPVSVHGYGATNGLRRVEPKPLPSS